MKKSLKKLALSKETLRGLGGESLQAVLGADSGRWTCYTSCMISQDSCQATCDTCFPC